jgi:adenylate cyclase
MNASIRQGSISSAERPAEGMVGIQQLISWVRRGRGWSTRRMDANAVMGVRVSPARADIERELERRMLLTERRRSAVLAWILGAIVVGRGIYHLRYGLAEDDLLGRGYTLVLIAAWVGFETHNFIWVSRRIREGREPVRSRAYVRAAIEVAMPTTMMAIMCQYDRPLNVLTSSFTYVYFLIIILSPLGLDPRLCLFTGTLAAASYGMLVGAYTEVLAQQWVGSAAIERLTFVMRIVLLFGGGLAAAFVSQRIRTTMVETISEVQERERVVALFGQHVSPIVVNRLLYQARGEHSELRNVCVMVLDIRNFTAFSEARAPDEVVRYLNTLWTFMVRTINEHNGIVNKFLGDGFLAVFGAALSNGSADCANAIAAAHQIMLELEGLISAGDVSPTRIGIALHAGPAIIGNVGSADRKEYTVIGDVVNVAFRIEALNKELGSTLLISEPVRDGAGIDAEPMAPMTLRGRRESIEVFRVA